MKYGDFASLVQLGAGLHIGTALLQTYGEIGVAPLLRTLSRINSLMQELKGSNQALVDDLAEELDHINANFEIFRIQLFNEFKKYVVINSIVAVILVVALVMIAYKTGDDLSPEMAVFLIFASVVPGPLSVAVLWIDASHELAPLKKRADSLEQRCITGA